MLGSPGVGRGRPGRTWRTVCRGWEDGEGGEDGREDGWEEGCEDGQGDGWEDGRMKGCMGGWEHWRMQ